MVGLFKKRRPLPESKVAEFLTQTEQLASLLDEEGETFWKARIVAAASKVRKSNWQGIDDFLSNYGTSGSFSECSIRVGEWQGENHHLWTPADKLKYQEFEALKGTTYSLARSLSESTAPSIFEAFTGAYRSASLRTKVLLWLMLLLLLGAFVVGPP